MLRNIVIEEQTELLQECRVVKRVRKGDGNNRKEYFDNVEISVCFYLRFKLDGAGVNLKISVPELHDTSGVHHWQKSKVPLFHEHYAFLVDFCLLLIMECLGWSLLFKFIMDGSNFMPSSADATNRERYKRCALDGATSPV